MCMIGTFSQYATIHQSSVVKVDDDLPLDKAVLVGCGVPTGWGSAVYAAKVEPGDTVVVYGIGGIGINAVQGARFAGAANLIAVDPLENKREIAQQLGATHAVASGQEAMELALRADTRCRCRQGDHHRGRRRRDGRSTGLRHDPQGWNGGDHRTRRPDEAHVHLSGAVMTLFRKEVKGTLFGNSNPTYDIPKMLDLYRQGTLRLDELITRTYTLDQVNEGYDDLLAGKNIRGVIVHDAA